jgi:hypothetical protein
MLRRALLMGAILLGCSTEVVTASPRGSGSAGDGNRAGGAAENGAGGSRSIAAGPSGSPSPSAGGSGAVSGDGSGTGAVAVGGAANGSGGEMSTAASGGSTGASGGGASTGASGGGGSTSASGGGSAPCPPGFDDCNGNPVDGCETDLLSDHWHCGECAPDDLCTYGLNWFQKTGHASCVAGQCQLTCVPGQVSCDGMFATGCESTYCDDCSAPCACAPGDCVYDTLASAQAMPKHLAIDASNLYWTGTVFPGWSPSLFQMPSGGGSPVTLVTGESSLGEIAVDAVHVYYAVRGTEANEYGDRAIKRVPIGGGPVTVLTTNLKDPSQIALDGTDVYVTCHGTPPAHLDGAIVKVPKNGGLPTTLVPSVTRARSVALHGSDVYYASQGTPENSWVDSYIAKVPAGGGAPIVIVAGPVSADLLLDTTHLYWSASPGELWRAPLAGGSPELLATDFVGGLRALDESYVYSVTSSLAWCDDFIYLGKIFRVPVSGGASVPVATGQCGPTDVVLDATRIYWTHQAHPPALGHIRTTLK